MKKNRAKKKKRTLSHMAIVAAGIISAALPLLLYIQAAFASTTVSNTEITTTGGLTVGDTSHLSGQIELDAGSPVTSTSYSVGRDDDSTNQLHFNVPGGATYEWSINNSAVMKIGTDGALGIGVEPDSTIPLYISRTLTPASGVPIGLRVEEQSEPTADGTSAVGALLRARGTSTSTTAISQIGGSQSVALQEGSGTVTDAVGAIGDVNSAGSGNITNAYGTWHRIFITGSGSITNAIEAFFAAPQVSGGGTISNLYGIYSNALTAGTVLNYFIYYNTTAANGFYVTGDGKVGIGVVSPSNKLEVNGTGSVTGNFSVESTGYLQFKKSGAGTPDNADCDSDSERGRLYINTTGNVLNVCNGASRGWDSLPLTD